MRKTIIILLILIIAITIILYASKNFLIDRFKIFLIQKIESMSPLGITIENMGYMPIKGIVLSGVTIYKDKLHSEKLFYLSSLDLKFSFLKLLRDKAFAPKIAIYDLNVGNLSINGAFGFSISLIKKIETSRDTLKAIDNIWLKNLSIKNEVLNVKNINGIINVSPESIKASNIRFIFNDEPTLLNLEVLNPIEELKSSLEVSSSKFNMHSMIKKEQEIYKIEKLDGKFLNSSFELIGEIEDIKIPIVSLYGEINVDIKDIPFLNQLNPEGKLEGSVYFKGNIKDSSGWEAGIKANADYLNIHNFKLKKLYIDARMKDRVVTIPIISAYPYNGTFIASAELDLNDEYIPYRLTCKLNNLDIAEFLKGTKLDQKGIRGLVFSELALRGDAKNIGSMEGSGRIFISQGDLGPMPVLMPLLGNLYGYFRGVLPGLDRINISGGNCDLYIAKRRISTNNLVLWGDVVSIHAKGYLDFDKNLNFEVENQFAEPEKAKGDWRSTLQEMITGVGKLMSKAYLTGTLEKPKWKFQYLDGVKNIFKGGLEKALKDIFEQ